MRDLESAIVTAVIESDDFVTAVTNQIEEEIEREVRRQVEDLSFDDEINEGVGKATEEMQGEIDNLKEEVEKLSEVQHMITSLQNQIDSLRQYMRAIDKTNEQYLVRVNRIVDRLQSIPLFGWFFKKLG